jgi:hypothetical protein
VLLAGGVAVFAFSGRSKRQCGPRRFSFGIQKIAFA